MEKLTFKYNVEIYDKQNKLVNTGTLTLSFGIPKLEIPQIDLNTVTPIFKESEFKRLEHLVNDEIKRDYDIITSENGEVIEMEEISITIDRIGYE